MRQIDIWFALKMAPPNTQNKKARVLAVMPDASLENGTQGLCLYAGGNR
jgi:hypothetical protein